MKQPDLQPPGSAPEVLDDDCVQLLDRAFADACSTGAAQPERARILRERVLGRVARSARASCAFVTVRRKDARVKTIAVGVTARTLYRASGNAELRAGEPLRVRVIELAPGARCSVAVEAGSVCEWLVMEGQLGLGGLPMRVRDFHRAAGDGGGFALTSNDGARVYLRESSQPRSGEPAPAGPQARHSVLDAEAGWDDFAPGIRRRVLWQSAGEAALLYHARPGAAVPRHAHGRDEECLMLDGEAFVDDVLLRRGDYQIAPAGTAHDGVSTDTGGVLFAHGDLDLDLQAY